ncbi:MAG: alpha-ketoacid dehydrogenase subunit beta [Myxococcales bacterium]|nr:alpha-ketoacid dehydrogenase subunit beta [Myxococcales bacterium]
MPWAEALIAAKTRKIDVGEGRVLSYAEALNEALRTAMEMDPKVFVFGQGVDDPAASFGVTRELQEKFGRERVFDVPLSEEAMTGVCVGSAMSGCRPVMTHNRPDFILLSMNQLVTHAAKIHYMDEGRTRVPMVIWAAIGRGWGSGAQHSQAVQGMLLGVPGLKIVMPSTPADAKGLLLAAIADDNPVLVFEHRWLMREQGVVPEGFYTVPIGKGVYRRRGADLTIAGTSHAIALALDAAEALACEGIDAEVIDLRSVKPLDEAILFESVEKTGKLLVVDTGWAMGGVCAEVACRVAEQRFDALRAPLRRIGLPDVPTPAGHTLEQLYYPNAETIAAQIRAMCA